MKTTPRLQSIINRIALKHDLDLDKPGAYLRLELPGNGQLVIENIGAGRVSVTEYVPSGDDFVMDPQLVFYTDYVPEGEVTGKPSNPPKPSRVPLETTDVMSGWSLFGELDA